VRRTNGGPGDQVHTAPQTYYCGQTSPIGPATAIALGVVQAARLPGNQHAQKARHNDFDPMPTLLPSATFSRVHVGYPLALSSCSYVESSRSTQPMSATTVRPPESQGSRARLAISPKKLSVQSAPISTTLRQVEAVRNAQAPSRVHRIADQTDAEPPAP